MTGAGRAAVNKLRANTPSHQGGFLLRLAAGKSYLR
jgi:hypothetical protein